MLINKNTKISKLIAENPDVIEVIAAINKHFRKLRNPVLRKVLASRVTITDAARIGGVSIQVFMDKLVTAGFEIEKENYDSNETVLTEANNMNMDKSKIVSLDVRPVIESGSDPFKIIMDAVDKLDENETLEIINSFEPIPLIHKLKKKGFDTWTERTDDGAVHTFFKLGDDGLSIKEPEEVKESSVAVFDDKVAFFGDQIKTIDVRHLEMPEPMTTILQTLETMSPGFALFVEHKKIPQFLLPELASRGYEILFRHQTDHHIQLLIYKENAS